MSNSQRHKIENELAFVLHSYPFRETSLVCEIFSRNYGRVALVARGARRPRSVLHGLLMSFQPLLLSWFGKHELRTLHSAEWQGGQAQLQGKALMCGLYLNELLLNLMTHDDPHERLFDYYQLTLQRLAQEQEQAPILRTFEKHLLQELGYALLLEHEAGNTAPIRAEVEYCYELERGAVPESKDVAEGLRVSGKTLLDLAADDYQDANSVRQGKQLMRMLLDHHLSGKILHTRELMRELHKI
jgi:DNA repair protein RecO (recombination protein O)